MGNRRRQLGFTTKHFVLTLWELNPIGFFCIYSRNSISTNVRPYSKRTTALEQSGVTQMRLGGILVAALTVIAVIYAVNYFKIGGGVSALGVKAGAS